jgi:cyclopropane fatty-acyl-phospholipid synthase-like methyltransferase
LELGSGVGNDAKFFMENGLDVTATDLSEQMVNECVKQGVRAQVLDLYDMDKLNKTYDAIFSMNVLLHVPHEELNQILIKINNTLNEDGLFYYGVYGGITNEIYIQDERTGGERRFFSRLSDEDLLKEVSMFEVVSFEKINVEVKEEVPEFHFQSLILRKKSKRH